jgi:mannose-6-phosphate isomerase-like protein (cupin superfamily)
MFDNYVYRAPVWVELFLVYAGGQGVGVPNLEVQRPRADGKARDATKGMQHSQNFDELFLFVGTDPHDTLNLGGEVVTYLGDEPYSITKASSVWVPAGVPHNPQYYKRVDRPYYMMVFALVDNAKFFEATLTATEAPKTFKF